ncbi:MAG: hypothetical protein IRY88_13780 [Rubrobacteraceae bacterium]|nr:hypothetical protein [Rubrobacteraceae bacterium]
MSPLKARAFWFADTEGHTFVCRLASAYRVSRQDLLWRCRIVKAFGFFQSFLVGFYGFFGAVEIGEGPGYSPQGVGVIGVL